MNNINDALSYAKNNYELCYIAEDSFGIIPNGSYISGLITTCAAAKICQKNKLKSRLDVISLIRSEKISKIIAREIQIDKIYVQESTLEIKNINVNDIVLIRKDSLNYHLLIRTK